MNVIRSTYSYLNPYQISKKLHHAGSNTHIRMSLIQDTVRGNCDYKSPVAGNGIQKNQQIAGKQGYNTSVVRKRQLDVLESLRAHNIDVTPIPTAHNQPVKRALFSLNQRLPEQLITHTLSEFEQNNLIEKNGTFNNSEINYRKASEIIFRLASSRESFKILKLALDGISSNYADSVYIANDYLLSSCETYAFVARYPDKAAQRMTETIHTYTYLLENGYIPIQIKNPWEGVANLKILQTKFKVNGKPYQLALGFESTRSELSALNEINSYLKILNKPQYFPIILKTNYRETYYHEDCILSPISGPIQESKIEFKSIKDIDLNKLFDHSRENSMAFIAKGGFTSESESIVKKAFGKVIELDTSNNPLLVNLVATTSTSGKKVILASTDLPDSKVDEISKAGGSVILKDIPTTGGGGDKLCCTNVGKKKPSIAFSEMQKIATKLNQTIPPLIESELIHIK